MKDNFDLKKYLKDNEVMERSNKYVAATLNEGTKKDELREKIKDMVMAEMAGMEDSMEEGYGKYEEDDMDEAMSKKKKSLDDGIKTADSYMNEAEDEETEEEEVEVVDTEDMPEEEEETVADKSGIMGNLEAAIEAARELGDEKLIDQLGNTITFYTRQHIAK